MLLDKLSPNTETVFSLVFYYHSGSVLIASLILGHYTRPCVKKGGLRKYPQVPSVYRESSYRKAYLYCPDILIPSSKAPRFAYETLHQ